MVQRKAEVAGGLEVSCNQQVLREKRTEEPLHMASRCLSRRDDLPVHVISQRRDPRGGSVGKVLGEDQGESAQNDPLLAELAEPGGLYSGQVPRVPKIRELVGTVALIC